MVTKRPEAIENEYDLDQIRIPITLKWKGEPKKYVLYESTGEAASKFRNYLIADATFVDGKVSKVGKVANAEPLLVSLCLFELVEKDGVETERPVPEAVVKKWPARVQKALFNRIKEISDLDEQSPEKQTLEEALQHASSPITLADFRKWVASLPNMDEKYDYRPLKTWMKPSAEENAKNEPSDMVAG